MVKLASNAFLATKISFINEIANVCEETGADVVEVARGHGPRRPHRPEVPAGRDRLRRLVLRAATRRVLARVRGQARLLRFEQLWARARAAATRRRSSADRPRGALVGPGRGRAGVPAGLGAHAPRTTTARWSRCARRWVAACARPPITRSSSATATGEEILTLKPAGDLDADDWLPLALGGPSGFAPELAPIMRRDRRARRRGRARARAPERREIDALARRRSPARRRAAARHQARRDAAPGEACAAGMDLGRGARDRRQRHVEPARARDRRALLARRRPVPRRGPLHATATRSGSSGRSIPSARQHLVDEVVSLLAAPRRRRCAFTDRPTARVVTVSSRIARPRGGRRCSASAATSYTQRIPDLAWEQTVERKRALLVRAVGGRRLVVARQRRAERDPRVGHDQRRARRRRRAAARRRRHRVRAGGAAGPRSRPRRRTGCASAAPTRSSARCSSCPSATAPASRRRSRARRKRIAPTGYRRFDGGTPWVRVVDVRRERVRRAGVLARGPGLAHGRGDQRA